METSDARVLTHPRFRREPVAAPLMTKQQIAAALNVTPRTIDRWIAEQGLPADLPGRPGAWCYLGKRRRFRYRETLEWLRAQH